MADTLRIGLDLDGVIIDHTPHKLQLAHELGYELTPWQTNANLMKRFVDLGHYRSMHEKMYSRLTPEAPPLAGALEALAEMKGEIYIVSARRSETIRYVQAWLNRHRVFDLVPAERIVFCGVSAEKRDVAARLGLQLFLDDQLKVLNSLPSTMRRIMLDQHGVSDEMDIDESILVAPTWADFAVIAEGRQLGLL